MIASIKNNGKGISLMLIASLFSCVGQLFWKISTVSGIIFALIGFFFYGIGALLMLTAYKHGKVSVLQPMLSMNYVLSIILGVLVFNETISFLKFVGIFVIILGVILIAGGDDK